MSTRGFGAYCLKGVGWGLSNAQIKPLGLESLLSQLAHLLIFMLQQPHLYSGSPSLVFLITWLYHRTQQSENL